MRLEQLKRPKKKNIRKCKLCMIKVASTQLKLKENGSKK
jgi:hypothetical protein